MALPADDLIVLRKWVGSSVPTDAELETLYNLYENYDKAVEHVLLQRLADLSTEVGSITVPGLSISRTNDLMAMKEILSKFYSSGGTGLEDTFEISGGLSVTSIKRNYPR